MPTVYWQLAMLGSRSLLFCKLMYSYIVIYNNVLLGAILLYTFYV